jgi:hypothetical protein
MCGEAQLVNKGHLHHRQENKGWLIESGRVSRTDKALATHRDCYNPVHKQTKEIHQNSLATFVLGNLDIFGTTWQTLRDRRNKARGGTPTVLLYGAIAVKPSMA